MDELKFNLRKSRGKIIINARCVDCEREDRKIYREKNKDIISQKLRKWKSENKEYIKKYHKKYIKIWYQKNKDKVLEQSRNWTLNNPERRLEMQRRWYKRNRDKVRKRQRIYYEGNKDLIKKRARERYSNNIKQEREKSKLWRENNRTLIRGISEKYRRKLTDGVRDVYVRANFARKVSGRTGMKFKEIYGEVPHEILNDERLVIFSKRILKKLKRRQ